MDTTSEIGNVIITMNDICSDYVEWIYTFD